MKQFVLASGNQGKLKEFNALLNSQHIEVLPQSHFNISDADEIGLSFVENAIIKARHAASISKLPALADDSGLEVDALNGAPGIYSARFAGLPSNDQANNEKLLAELINTDTEKRTARFQCVLVYMRHAADPTPLICQGSWEGRILYKTEGENGFGYDPLFWVPEHNCASAELSPEIKNKISHRAQAIQQFIKQLPL